MFFSDIIGKEVFSVYEGKRLGTVSSAEFSFQKKKIDKIVIFNDEDDFENIIKTQNITTISEVVLVKNEECAIPNLGEGESFSFVGKLAISLSGVGLGSIRDIELNDELELQKFILVDGAEILADDLLIIGENAVIFSNSREKKKSSFRPQSRKQFVPEIGVKVMKIGDSEPENDTLRPAVPKRLFFPENNEIIGRRAEKTLIDKNSEVIVKRGEVITKDTLDKAKRHQVSINLAF